MPFYRVPFLAGAGVQTDDGRTFTEITWRNLPLPLAFQDDTQHADLASSSIVGQIVDLRREPDGTISALIDVDPRDGNGRAIHADGARAAQMIEQGGQGISIDGLLPIDAVIEEHCEQEDEDGWCMRFSVTFSEVIIGGSTLTPIPAFARAIVDPTRLDAAGEPVEQAGEPVGLALVASAALEPIPAMVARSGMTLTAGAALDMASWALQPEHFTRPELTAEANYINIEDDGRIWGWIAAAERCHQGIPGQCVLAANESTDLSDFLRNTLPIGDQRVPVGFLTMGRLNAPRGHQPPDQPAAVSPEHYDDASCIAAIVTAGIVPDGDYSARSVWFSGSVRPTLDPWERTVLAAAQASGDWRGDPGQRERTLRAALVVPVPGFLRQREPVLASAAPCGCGTQIAPGTACGCGSGSAPDPQLAPAEVVALKAIAEERLTADLAALPASI